MSYKKIGLFYGSSTCYTEMSAEKIQKVIGEELVDVQNIADKPISSITNYDYLIFGIPTWDYGELQEDWEEIWDELQETALEGKKFAIYGQGDQVGYPQWFLDAMGFLHHLLVNNGAQACGYWPNEGYEFEQSKALTADGSQFVGLALDDENQFDQSAERIRLWCTEVLKEFGLSKPNN